jgi:hypothetical protein
MTSFLSKKIYFLLYSLLSISFNTFRETLEAYKQRASGKLKVLFVRIKVLFVSENEI